MLMRDMVRVVLAAGILTTAHGLNAADSAKTKTDHPPVSEPTPTVEAGMPLFSSEEVSQFFVEMEPPEKTEHPIFVGKEDDIVELETFQVYSDKLTLRQSLKARMSESGWNAMMARLEALDPEQTKIADYDKRAADRFFSGQTPGGAADRPDPGGIDAMDAFDAAVKAFKKVYGP